MRTTFVTAFIVFVIMIAVMGAQREAAFADDLSVIKPSVLCGVEVSATPRTTALRTP